MINQFGVIGDKLKNGEFQHYEITLNGEWAGTVHKSYLGDWVWSVETGVEPGRYDYGFRTAKEAIEAIKKHLTEGGK